MKKIDFYRYPHQNVGDTLTPFILRHFRPDLAFRSVPEANAGKVIAVGSIMRVVKPGDTVIGAGIMRESDEFPQAPEVRYLAVRGRLTGAILREYGATVPEVYGDPGLLLPLMYNPAVEITHEVGIIPHFVDKAGLTLGLGDRLAGTGDWKVIDVLQDHEAFIREIKSCRRIISSSLHGIVLAEAYGIPAEWVMLSSKVIGNGFKFRDYLTGTGRKPQKPGKFPPINPRTLERIQQGLLQAIRQL